MNDNWKSKLPIGSLWGHCYDKHKIDSLWKIIGYGDKYQREIIIEMLAIRDREEAMVPGENTKYPVHAILETHAHNWTRVKEEDVPLIVLEMLDD